MALTVKKDEWIGSKIVKAIQQQLGTTGMVIVVGAIAGVAIAAAVKLGIFAGIGALVTGGIGLISKSLFLKVGLLMSLPALYGVVVGGIQRIWNFNWNVTDKELDAMQAKLAAIYGLMGETVGQALGYLVCGAIPGAIAFVFNPAVAKVVLANVEEEAKEEVYQGLAMIANSAALTLAAAVGRKAFKSARRWLKRPDTPIYNFLKGLMGENFTKWGDEGQKPFTFSGAVEERIEEIPDENWRSFAEEFVEGFGESCIEAGWIVTNTIHQQMAAQKLMQREFADQTQIVEIDFSRNDDPIPNT